MFDKSVVNNNAKEMIWGRELGNNNLLAKLFSSFTSCAFASSSSSR